VSLNMPVGKEMMKADLLDRVKEMVARLEMSLSKFVAETGIPNSTVYYLFQRGKRPNGDTQKILETWLRVKRRQLRKRGEDPDAKQPLKDDIWKRKVVGALKKQQARMNDIDVRINKLEEEKV